MKSTNRANRGKSDWWQLNMFVFSGWRLLLPGGGAGGVRHPVHDRQGDRLHQVHIYNIYTISTLSTQYLYNIYTEYLLSVTITYDSIPGWGRCYSRAGHQHVLEDVTVNGDSCYKCAKIQVSGMILL